MNVCRPIARLGIEGGRDIFQAGPDLFVTLSKRFSKYFATGLNVCTVCVVYLLKGMSECKFVFPAIVSL